MKSSRCNCVANRVRNQSGAELARVPARSGDAGAAAVARGFGNAARRAVYLALMLVVPGALIVMTAVHLVNWWRHGTNPLAEVRRMLHIG